MRYRSPGWFRESFRHSLASRGIKTGKNYFAKSATASDIMQLSVREKLFGSGKNERWYDYPYDRKYSGEDEEGVKKFLKSQGIGGVETKRPREALERAREGQKLSEEVVGLVKRQRSVDRAVKNADKGSVSLALTLLSENKSLEGRNLTVAEKEALQSALNAYALRQSQANLPVPDLVKERIDKVLRAQIERKEKQAEKEALHPTRTAVLEELGKDAQAAALAELDALALSGKAGVGAGKAALGESVNLLRAANQVQSGEIESGLGKNIDRLEATPPFEPLGKGEGMNAFVDDKGMFGDFGAPVSIDKLQPLMGSGNTNVVLQGSNNALVGNVAKEQETYTDNVSRKVDSLFSRKKEVANVDMSAFEKGERAFKNGDREKLIKAISELQSQEAILRDRWNLVGQTHAQVLSAQNNESAYKKSASSNVLFGKGSGAKVISDQTKKINDVRGDILKANNEVFARRKMLEYDLQRMDAAVPPVTSVPKVVKRFDENESGVAKFFKSQMKGAIPRRTEIPLPEKV